MTPNIVVPSATQIIVSYMLETGGLPAKILLTTKPETWMKVAEIQIVHPSFKRYLFLVKNK